MVANETAGIHPDFGNLTLRNVMKSSAGQYSCAAENEEGETYSAPFTLTVQCKYVPAVTARAIILQFHNWNYIRGKIEHLRRLLQMQAGCRLLNSFSLF